MRRHSSTLCVRWFVPFAFVLVGAGCSPTPASVFDDFLRALHRQDLEATLEFYGDDFVMETREGTFRATREYIPMILEWDFAADTRFELREKRVSGDTVIVVMRESNPFLELTGMGPYLVRSHYVVEGRRFASQTFELLEGHGDLRRAIGPVVQWAMKHEPDTIEEVYPGGRFTYSADAVRNWIALLRRWKAATSSDSSAGPG